MARTPGNILIGASLAPVIRTATMRGFEEITGYGHNKNYSLLSTGKVDSYVTETGRRLVVVSGSSGSWEAYLDRLRTGQQRDPAEKAAAQLAYKLSLKHSGAANAARARGELRDKRRIPRVRMTRGDGGVVAPPVAAAPDPDK
jgi:hypothetical protein